MRHLIAVGCGGCIGSIMRYLVSGWAQTLSKSASFPVGTLSVNVLGCFAIGLLGGYADNIEAFSATTRSFLLIGLLGGFTTFSTFSYETLGLLRDGQPAAALANVLVHVLSGLFAVWAGYALSTIAR